MAANPGTLEQLVTELAGALGTVSTQFHPEQVRATLAQLDIVVPADFVSSSGIEPARASLVAAAVSLEPAVDSLLTAISDEDYAGIASSTASVIGVIADLYSAIDDFATALQSAASSLPADTQAKITAVLPIMPRRLVDLVLISQIDQYPGLSATLTVLGIIERSPVADAPELQVVTFYPQRLLKLLSDPQKHLENLYDWGLPGFDGTRLLPVVQQSMDLLLLPNILKEPGAGSPMTLEAFAVDIYPTNGISPPGLTIEAVMPVRGNLDQSIPLPHPAWSVDLHGTAELLIGALIRILPPLQLDIEPPSGQINGEFSATIRGAPDTPFILFGRAGGSRIEIGGVEIGGGTSLSWNSTSNKASAAPFLTGDLSAGKVIINGDGGDSLIDEVLSGIDIESNFELGFDWNIQRGLQFRGGAGINLDLQIYKTIGPIRLDALHLALALNDNDLVLDLGVTIGAELGPLLATVERMGIKGTFSFPDTGGNIGPAQLDIDFLPPRGVALAMDTPSVKLGGFLSIDPDNHRYAGAIELSIADTFDLTAIGLITTRFPDGSEGFSLLFIISTRFPSPIPLSYNFYLSGVGGLLGLHRSVDIDRLRSGLQQGAVDDILFPEDVVRNMNALVTDLREIFPATRDQFLVGPMAEITWNTPPLITGQLGLIIEFANPVRIAILGVLRVAVPTKDEAIVDLKVNFLGTIDFDRGLLSFDASIYDSFIGYGSFKFTLEGDIALRISWGDKPDFLTSVGGFHPSYNPPTHLSLPPMKRLKLSLLKDNPRLTLTCYFALTTNTVQFGAELDFYFGVAGFSVVGNFGFDVLFQFVPFRFIAAVRASLAVKAGSTTILSLSLSFELAGTSPWSAKGTASFRILFFKVSVKFSKTWGERKQITLPKVDVLPSVLEEFGRDVNWNAALSDLAGQQAKLLPSARAADALLFDPGGMLTIGQNIIPLATPFTRFGNNTVADISVFDVQEVRVGTTVLDLDKIEEQFAPAAFNEMSDADKLKASSYEPFKSGVTAQGGNLLQTDHVITRPVRHEQIISDADPEVDTVAAPMRLQRSSNAMLFSRLVPGGAIGRSSLSQKRLRLGQKKSQLDIASTTETYAVVSSSNLRAADADSVSLTRSAAEQRIKALTDAGGDAVDFDIVPSFQMAS